jgi:hypothetical protein
MMVSRADAAGVPAAEYLAHAVGLQERLGTVSQSDIVAVVIYAGLGYLLYRVASR